MAALMHHLHFTMSQNWEGTVLAALRNLSVTSTRPVAKCAPVRRPRATSSLVIGSCILARASMKPSAGARARVRAFPLFRSRKVEELRWHSRLPANGSMLEAFRAASPALYGAGKEGEGARDGPPIEVCIAQRTTPFGSSRGPGPPWLQPLPDEASGAPEPPNLPQIRTRFIPFPGEGSAGSRCRSTLAPRAWPQS